MRYTDSLVKNLHHVSAYEKISREGPPKPSPCQGVLHRVPKLTRNAVALLVPGSSGGSEGELPFRRDSFVR